MNPETSRGQGRAARTRKRKGFRERSETVRAFGFASTRASGTAECGKETGPAAGAVSSGGPAMRAGRIRRPDGQASGRLTGSASGPLCPHAAAAALAARRARRLQARSGRTQPRGVLPGLTRPSAYVAAATRRDPRSPDRLRLARGPQRPATRPSWEPRRRRLHPAAADVSTSGRCTVRVRLIPLVRPPLAAGFGTGGVVQLPGPSATLAPLDVHALARHDDLTLTRSSTHATSSRQWSAVQHEGHLPV